MTERIRKADQSQQVQKRTNPSKVASANEARQPQGSSSKWSASKPDRRKNVSNDEVFIEILGFGKGRISFNRVEQYWKPAKVTEAFFYLMTYRNFPVRIEQLAMDLWPHSSLDNGKRNVKKVMIALRDHLKSISREQIKIIYLNSAYTLTVHGCYNDVEQFEKLYQALIQEPLDREDEIKTLSLLYYMQELYEGPYLSKNNWHWAADYRHALGEKYFNAMHLLAEILSKKGDINGLILCCDKLSRHGFSHRLEVKHIRTVLQEQIKDHSKRFPGSGLMIAYR